MVNENRNNSTSQTYLETPPPRVHATSYKRTSGPGIGKLRSSVKGVVEVYAGSFYRGS